MKCLQGFFLVFLLTLTALTPAAQATSNLRVVSWNIEWFPGLTLAPEQADADAHMEQVQGELARLSPDILIASEIRDQQAFIELTSVVPGLNPVVVSAYPSRYGEGFWPQQLAIASRLEVQATWWESFRPTHASQVRGFACAVLRVPESDEVILVYALHLRSNRARTQEQTESNYTIREDAVVQLLAHIEEMERLRFPNNLRGVIVGGDFNTNHDGQFGDDTIARMEAAGFHNTWRGVAREDRLTWRGSDRFEATTFDYIFTKGFPETVGRLIEVEEGASDHWPVGVLLPLEASE